jgi:hypothetical protein
MRAFATPVTRFFGRSTNRPEVCRAAPCFFGRVLIDAQIGSPLSGANRKTFAHFETYRF